MASLDSLPADQRAVLQLVLQRRRTYDEIARLLSIDRAAVRRRALTAFDLLGPQTGVADQRRALITDYLLGQLPPKVSEQTRDRLAESPSERAWARVVASELASLTNEPLPEIPTERSGARTPAPEPEPLPLAVGPEPDPGAHQTVAAPRSGRASVALRDRVAAASGARTGDEDGARDTGSARGSGRSSRRGGLILLLAAVVILAVVVVIVTGSSSSSPKKAVASTPTISASTSTTASTGSGSTAARVLAQINLTPPSSTSKAAGIAEVLKEGATDGIAIVAQHVLPNTTKPANAYAVWLYNSATDAHILGFVNPGVTSTGRLSTAGGLPSNASHYKELIVTLETQASPTTPGTIILQGALKGLS
jgi:hypothetical protein